MQSITRQLLRANRLAVSSTRAASLTTARQQSLVALSSSRLFSTSLTLHQYDRRDGGGDGERQPRRQPPRRDNNVDGNRRFEPRVEAPPSATLYLGNLHYDVEQNDLQELLGNFGEIKEMRFVMRDGRRMGSAFVDFAEQNSAERAHAEIQEHTPEIFGRAVRASFAISRPKEDRPRPSNPEGPKLFISNAVGVDLQELFKGHNPVDVWQPMDKPYAFVTFDSIEKAKEIVEQFNGQAVGSKLQPLSIGYAKPRETGDAFAQKRPRFGGGDNRSSRPSPRKPTGNRESGSSSNPYY